MKPSLLILVTFFCAKLFAMDSLQVVLNTSIIEKGKNISFECTYTPYLQKTKSISTLHILIQDQLHTKKWRYRYPMYNGKAAGSLKVDSSLKEGVYEIHFVLQQLPLTINGIIHNYNKKDSAINLLLSSGKQFYASNIHVNNQGFFKVNKYQFEDSVSLNFSPTRKQKNNPLEISIDTPIDSSFEPLALHSAYIEISNLHSNTSIKAKQSPIFNYEDLGTEFTLSDVTVTGILKTKAETFNEKNVAALYKRDDEKILSGFDNFTLYGYNTVFDYIANNIPGLQIYPITKRGSRGADTTVWQFVYRSSTEVTLFIDEHIVDIEQFLNFPLQEIAIIKIIPPPFIGAWGGNPFALLIYSLKPEFKQKNNKHIFKVRGYTPAYWLWK